LRLELPMLIRTLTGFDPLPSELTPWPAWRARRSLLSAGASVAAFSIAAPAFAQSAAPSQLVGGNVPKLLAKPGSVVTMEKATPYKDVTSYNNFYEFGTEKEDPARYANTLKPRPWSLKIEGEVKKPHSFDLDELLKLAPLEERIYRMRCVEGWSMVIPWIGVALSEVIKRVEPTGNAKFIEFYTLADPKQMPGLKSSVLQWPYVEGLRLDEANHPLTLLTLGLYGEVLPNANGAPVRVVVPWKYGFKSGKSIVRMRFVEKQPITSWNRAAPHEYGFYSNVNPEVDHPRWSQATERRIGEDGFTQRKRKTLMFNGYADQVASLYGGMDLRKLF
jgi:methionine sulfoxide reductase catalytic subunit